MAGDTSAQSDYTADYMAASEAAEFIRGSDAWPPRVALILGTGLGGLAERIESPVVVDYADIPHFPPTTVAGHAGRLVLGTLEGVPVAAMRGRFHLYEGYTPAQVVHPLRALRLLGADTLIVTNAAGGLDAAQHAGDLLAIADHIGLATMAGRNPLVGPNDERFGPRFPAMTAAYDPALRALAHQVAAERGISLREGVYAMVSGPNYETPAELRFLKAMGAHAVGMSTVPEVIAARHMGMRVLAISCLTNVVFSDEAGTPAEPNHAEVVAAAEAAGARLGDLISGVLRRLPASLSPGS